MGGKARRSGAMVIALVSFGALGLGWFGVRQFAAKQTTAAPALDEPATAVPRVRGPIATRRPDAAPQPDPLAAPEAAEPEVTAPVDAGPASAATARLSPLNVRVIGTVTGRTPAESTALVLEGDAKQAVVRRIGDTVADGAARITEIAPQRVVVERGGQLEFLEVGGRDSNPRSANDVASMSADEFFKLPLDQLDAALERSGEKRMAVDLGQARSEVRGMARFSGEPGQAGMAVEGFKRDDALAEIGLRPGDRIVEVDGVPVRSVEEGVDALARTLYSQGGSTVLTVERFDGSRVQVATDGGAMLRRKPAR